MATGEAPRTVLFLQGPVSPFFRRIADRLEAEAPHIRVRRINLNWGDWLFWRRPGATNYRGRAKDWPAFIQDYIRREGVTDLVLLGEQRFYHRAAIDAAKAAGATVVATDFGYLRPDWVTFELDGLTGASRFPKDPMAVRAIAATAAEPDLEIKYRDRFWLHSVMDIVYHIGSSIFRPLYPFYETHHVNHPIATYLGTAWRMVLQKGRTAKAMAAIAAAERENSEVFAFPLQIARDFSIRAYSNFESLDAAIDLVIGSFAANARADAKLVLKIHPLDPGLRDWRKVIERAAAEYGVSERVTFIDGGDLARLIRLSAGVVVVNSTVGLLSLQLGRPTIALGQAIYDMPGLTSQSGLDAFWRARPTPDMGLVGDFVKAIAATILLRGTLYSDPGLAASVEQATARLLERSVNQPRVAAE